MVFVCPIDGKTDFREAFQTPNGEINPFMEYPPLGDCFYNNNKRKTEKEQDPPTPHWQPPSDIS